jgi:hypothetical protein
LETQALQRPTDNGQLTSPQIRAKPSPVPGSLATLGKLAEFACHSYCPNYQIEILLG